jgi:ubiquinone/menaquinone biosynthesis C-methylase UbiE
VETKSWYRLIAAIYDPICRPLFAGPRRAAITALQVLPGQTVVDLCCGTGLNLPQLSRAVGSQGRVIGVDFSSHMLRRAQRRIERHGLSNVHLIQGDAATFVPDAELLTGDRAEVNGVICTFGLAVAPNWQQIRAQAWDILCPGGRFCVADNQPFRRFPLRAVNWPWVLAANFCGAAEIRRPTWELPEPSVDRISPQSFLAGFVFVTSAKKPIPGISAARQQHQDVP